MPINTTNTNFLIVNPTWIIDGPVPVLDTLRSPRCYLRRTSKKKISDFQFSKTLMWVLLLGADVLLSYWKFDGKVFRTRSTDLS